jgi:diacylglycerol kinase family enzyme
MKKAAIPILLNPSAGAGRAGRLRRRLEEELHRQGVSFELFVTESEGHLRALTRELGVPLGLIAGAGGDSTFLIMADEIIRAGVPTALAMIGLGSSNDIPAAFGLNTVAIACRTLLDGRPRRIDAGRIAEGETLRGYFIGQANIGLGAVVNRYVTALAERRPRLAARQTLAGFLGIRNALHKRKVPVHLSIKSEAGLIEGSFTAAIFANTRFWATGKTIAPEATPDDGRLDACLIGPCSMKRLARIYAAAKTGRHVLEPEVRTARAKEFTVRIEVPLDIQSDGEIIDFRGARGALRIVTIGAVPSALTIMVPAADDGQKAGRS